MKNIWIGKAAVLGLTLAACSAFAQFSTVSSRTAMNANDTLTWNQLGGDGAAAPLPFSATSVRGVHVTGSQPGWNELNVAVVGGVTFGGFGFPNGDVVLIFANTDLVTLNFNPPVTAVGMNVSSGFSSPPLAFTGSIQAYRGTTLLGTSSGSATINVGDSNTAPFLGVRDEGGISKIVIDQSNCNGCAFTLINQLSLVTPQRVSVDVKPGADKSVLVADSNAKLPFAILSAPGFDASTAVDISSLRFGRTGEEVSVLSCAGGVDVNYDFLPDLTCQFSVKSSAFVAGDLTAKLKGKLTNGNTIYGTADVIVK